MDIYKILVKDSGGACPYDKIQYVYNNFINKTNINKIVEIGVYNGCFILPIATLFKNAKCIGIDPYKSFIQHDIDDPHLNATALAISNNQQFLDQVYKRLTNNINIYNINNVEIIKDYSQNVSIGDINILHIDGNHDYVEVLKDLYNFKNNIVKGGIIIMDDTNWKSVNSAMLKFLDENKDFILTERFNFYSIITKLE